MKLIKLEVNNFRQFHGKQVVDFSIDKEKNVTLIHGENNGGKTALLNALRWCLYEETTENLQDPNTLINKHAQTQRNSKYHVKVQLLHNNKLYEVVRSRSQLDNASKLQIYEIIDGCYSPNPESNPNMLINTFLPKEMSQYFFYQGEGTGTLNSQNDFSQITLAISKVLGLTIAEKALQHLNRIKLDYQRDLKQYDTDNKIQDLTNNKSILNHKLFKNNETLIKYKSELDIANKDFEHQVSQLSRFDKSSIEGKIKLRTKNENLLCDYKRQLKNAFNKKSDYTLSWITNSFQEKLSQTDLSSINTDELNNSLRYTVDKQLIASILENQECICGTCITSDSPAAQIISELKKSAIDPELKRRWKKVTGLYKKISPYASPKDKMIHILSDINAYEEQIRHTENEINDLSHTIIESNIDDIQSIESKKNDAQLIRDKLLREISLLDNSIPQIERDLKGIDDRISQLSSTLPKAKKINKLIKATDKIIELYSAAIHSSTEGVDLIILQKMKMLFSRVAFNGYSVKKSSTNGTDSFTWAIVDKDGKRVAAGNGYQAMLAISFIVALIQFSKERANNKHHLLTPGTIAPFIADSILAFIGPDNGRELVRYIAASVEQAIFMFSQAQWTEAHTDIGIRDKIGKEYNLVQHTVLTEEEFKGQYPTRLSIQGLEFDVVRFGSEFDMVTIEEILHNG
jgi:DNA sulfur modification protein DndD